MRKLYGSTSWRRVLALVLVFVMMFSVMGTSGYSVFAEDLAETGEEVVVAEPEAVTPEVTEDIQGPSPGTEEEAVAEPVEETEEGDVEVEAIEEAAEEAEEPVEEAVEEAVEEEESEEPAEAVEETEEGEELEEDAELVEAEDEEGEESEEDAELVEAEDEEGEAEETLVAEAAQIIEEDDGAEAPAEEEAAEPVEEAEAEEPSDPSLIADVVKQLEEGQIEEETAAEGDEEALVEGEELLEEEALEEEVSMPEINEDQWFNGTHVTVYAPEGAFPEGTTVKIVEVELDSVQYDAVAEAVDGEIVKVKAYDITFYDADGIEIQPEEGFSVSVRISSSSLKDPDNRQVVHIDDNDEATRLDGVDVSKTAVEFDADHFSIYAIIESKPAETVTYVFYDKAKDDSTATVIREQTVIEGDTLFEPSHPVDGTKIFEGWLIDGSTPLEFDDNGELTVGEIPENVDDNKINVYPQFSVCYFATFRDQDGNVFSRIGVKAGDSLSINTLPVFTPKLATQNMAGWSDTKNTDGTNTGDPSKKVTFPVENVQADAEYWPIIETGYWIHFDANRNHVEGMSDVNVSYTAPVFVHQGQAGTAPTKPIADIAAYTFDDWYTTADCTTKYNWNTVLTGNITLYANWDVGQAHYNVIIWQQKVTDDKKATGTARSWDYLTSYTYSATIGSTVTYSSLPNNVRNLTYTGFTKDDYDTSITVAADGSSTLNIYYRRNLITIDFYVYYRYNAWNYNENSYNSQYAREWRSINGLYGQTFEQAAKYESESVKQDYVWPADYSWRLSGQNQTESLLTSFTDNTTYYCIGSNNTYVVYHVQQNSDGTWPSNRDNATVAKIPSTSTGNFQLRNKFANFHVVGYSTRDSYSPTGTSASAGGEVPNGTRAYPLTVYHARDSFTIEFYNGNERVDSASKLYEASLAEYASKTLEPADEARYTFGGWAIAPNVHAESEAIDWSTQTMPAQTLRVYAIWVSIAYNVKLDLGADDAVMDENQSTNFWPTYGATINDSYMNNATREGYSLVGWVDANGNAWNFANAVTKDLCDEGPLYDANYQNYYYVLHLTAKWRLDANIHMKYELAGGAGTFTDSETYIQYGSVTVLPGAPTPPNDKMQFIGWMDGAGNLHQPGETFVIDSEELLSDGNTRAETGLYLVLTAVYGTTVPKGSITYHATYNDATSVDNNGGNGYVWNNGSGNETVTLPSNTFTREGYILVGWNSDKAKAEAGVVEFAAGKDVLVSAMNTTVDSETLIGNNDLYAVWAQSVVITVTGSSEEKTYNGETQFNEEGYTYTITIGGVETSQENLPDGVTVTVTGTTASGKDVGTYSETVSVSAASTKDSYVIEKSPVTATVTLKITPAAVTVKANDVTKVYDGNAATTNGATVTGLIGNDTVAYTVAFAVEDVTNVQETPNAITASGEAKQGNYTVSYQSGKLTITATEEELTVSLDDDEYTYDGGSHYNKNTAETNAAGGTTTIKYATSADAADEAWTTDLSTITATAVADSCTIYVKATNPNYKNTATDTATLTIKPAAVTVKANDVTKVYDGNAATTNGATVTGLIGNDTVAYTVAFAVEDVTNVQETPNAITASGEAKQGNYTVSYQSGKLTITATEEELTVSLDDDEYTYDGGSHYNKNTAETNAAGGTTTIKYATSADAADEAWTTDLSTITATAVADSCTIYVKATNPNYKNTATDTATLTIKPVTLTITAGSDSKVYDGTALTKNSYTNTALVQGDSISSVTVTGSQTLVGSSDNVPSAAKIANAEGNDVTANYDITYAKGTLTVTDGTGEGEKPVDPELVVTKADANAGEGTTAPTYKSGDTVTFKITATNIYEEAKTITLSEIEGVTLAQSTFENVAGGATIETTATYTIKEADVMNGEFENTVTAAIENLTKKASATVDIEALDTTLSVKKEITNEPEDGEAFKLGETIEYTITVTNDGNVAYTNVVVKDELIDETGETAEIIEELGSWTIEELGVGASESYTVKYVVTEDDILAGSVTNKAVATADPIDDPDNPDEPQVPTGEDEVTTGDEGTPDDPDDPPTPPIEEKNGHLTIEKETTNKKENGAAFRPGETIEYRITVTNDGNLTITDITVTDELTGDKWTIDSLAPAEIKTYTASYKVTDADAEAGEVLNVAAATGTSPDPDEPEVPVEPGKDTEIVEPTPEPPVEKKTVVYYTNYPVDSMENVWSDVFTVEPGDKAASFNSLFDQMPGNGWVFNGWKDQKSGKTYSENEVLVAIQGAATGSAASSSEGTDADADQKVTNPDADFILYAQWTTSGSGTPNRPPKPPVEEPDEPIEDPDTPLAPAEEEPEEVIPEDDTPFAPYEEEPDESIDEEPTPFSPYTGDDRHTAAWGFVSLLSLAGIVVVARKRREE